MGFSVRVLPRVFLSTPACTSSRRHRRAPSLSLSLSVSLSLPPQQVEPAVRPERVLRAEAPETRRLLLDFLGAHRRHGVWVAGRRHRRGLGVQRHRATGTPQLRRHSRVCAAHTVLLLLLRVLLSNVSKTVASRRTRRRRRRRGCAGHGSTRRKRPKRRLTRHFFKMDAVCLCWCGLHAAGTRDPGHGDGVTDVVQPRHKQHEALEPHAPPPVRCGAKPAQIQVPVQPLRDAVRVHGRL